MKRNKYAEHSKVVDRKDRYGQVIGQSVKDRHGHIKKETAIIQNNGARRIK